MPRTPRSSASRRSSSRPWSPPDAYERWRLVFGPRPDFLIRVRHHIRVARRLDRRGVPGYLARRLRNAGARTFGRLRGRDTIETPNAGQMAQAALASHRPRPLPGRPLVVLHRDDTAVYTEHPETAWAALGTEGVHVIVVRGSSHTMLEEAGVQELGSVLGAWAASIAAGSR